MSWRYPDVDDIAAAERRVYARREALRWRRGLVAARLRRTMRSRTAVFLAGLAGLALPMMVKSGAGRRLLAAGSLLRWVFSAIRLLKV